MANTFHRYVNGKLVERTVDGGASERFQQQPATWPITLVPLKLFARPGDRGAGDIIARTIGPIGGTAFKVWYKALFGKSCGCGARQESLNQRWPLEVSHPG